MASTKNITIEEIDDGFILTYSDYSNDYPSNGEYHDYNPVAPVRTYAATLQEAVAKIATLLST